MVDAFATWLHAEIAAGRLPWCSRENLGWVQPYGNIIGVRVVGTHWPLKRASFLALAVDCVELAARHGSTLLLFTRPVIDQLRRCQASGATWLPDLHHVSKALYPLAAAGHIGSLKQRGRKIGTYPWSVRLPGNVSWPMYVLRASILDRCPGGAV